MRRSGGGTVIVEFDEGRVPCDHVDVTPDHETHLQTVWRCSACRNEHTERAGSEGVGREFRFCPWCGRPIGTRASVVRDGGPRSGPAEVVARVEETVPVSCVQRGYRGSGLVLLGDFELIDAIPDPGTFDPWNDIDDLVADVAAVEIPGTDPDRSFEGCEVRITVELIEGGDHGTE